MVPQVLLVSLPIPTECAVCPDPFHPDERRLAVVVAVDPPVRALAALESPAEAVAVRVYHLRCAPPPGTPGRVLGGPPVRITRTTHPAEHFAQVAQVYRAALEAGDAPVMAVAEVLHTSRSTAAKWVQTARARGLLPATQSGVAVA